MNFLNSIGRHLLTVGALVLAGLVPANGQAAAGDPGPDVPAVLVQGNLTCSQLLPGMPGMVELKVGNPVTGNYSDSSATFHVDVRQTNLGPVFDWSINGGRVLGVFAKGGVNGNLYDYQANNILVFLDDGLHSPTNPTNHKYYGLSHISFCYLPGAPKVDIGKVCATGIPNPTFNPDTNLVHTVFNVPITNSGFGTVYDVTISEGSIFSDPLLDKAGSQCSLTGGATSALTLPASLLTLGNAPVPVKVADELAQGASLNLTVECDSSRTQLSNTISVQAKSSAGAAGFDVPLASHTTAAAETCGLALSTGVTVEKACRSVAMVGGVTPQVCVGITVSNTSQQDLQVTKLADVESVGQSVDLLSQFVAANGGSAILQQEGAFGSSITVERCYTPTANGGDPLAPAGVNYQDQATAAGFGVFDGALTGDVTSNIATCPLCPPPPLQ